MKDKELEDIMKEVHLRHIKNEDKETGFRKYYGFIQDGYRFEIKVPTTIYDRQVAVIRAWAYDKGTAGNQTYRRGELVKEVMVKLESMPFWDTERQTIMLKRHDESVLNKKVNALVKKLPEMEY